MPSPPIVTDSPSTPKLVDVDKQFPEVFVTCAVTHAMSKSVSEVQNRKSVCKKGKMIPGLSFFPFCFSPGVGGGTKGGCHP